MKEEVKRMFSTRLMYLAILLGAAGIALGAEYPLGEIKSSGLGESIRMLRTQKAGGLLETGNFVSILEKAFSSKTVSFLLPVAAVLPWSDSFLTEQKSGFLKAYLPRTNRKSYIQSKIFAVALSGFLAWVMAGIVMLFVFFAVFFPMEKSGSFPLKSLISCLLVLLRVGILGAIISSLGGVCGAVMESSYMAYGIPFVAYYFCIILHERYFKESLWLYPIQWITGTAFWGEEGLGLWLFLILFLLAVMGIHGGVLYGELEEI